MVLHYQQDHDVLLKINNFTEHLHQINSTWDHDRVGKKSNPSEVTSEYKHENTGNTIKKSNFFLSQLTWVAIAFSPITSSVPFHFSHFQGKILSCPWIDLILLPDSIQPRRVPCFFRHPPKPPNTFKSWNASWFPHGVWSPLLQQVTQANMFHCRCTPWEFWLTGNDTTNDSNTESFDPRMTKSQWIQKKNEKQQ